MKQLKNIKNKLKWEDYYNPDFDWNNQSFYVKNKLSEDFIREFKDKVNWKYISEYQKLSEKFIREFKWKVDWICISKKQRLSERFIREFKNRVDWDMIFEYQKLSKEFKEEFKKELTFYEAAEKY